MRLEPILSKVEVILADVKSIDAFTEVKVVSVSTT
jgi:hypothetical protein